MERDRLKTLLLPLSNKFDNYYERFEQRTQNLNKSDLEENLESSTYRHHLREMFVRAGAGLALMGISSLAAETLLEPGSVPQIIYMFSLAPQAYLCCVVSATRDAMIEKEEKILKNELARR